MVMNRKKHMYWKEQKFCYFTEQVFIAHDNILMQVLLECKTELTEVLSIMPCCPVQPGCSCLISVPSAVGPG